MAKFTTEQAADVLAIKQVIYEWGNELDVNDGLRMESANVLTADCRYNVGGEWREGLAAAAKFYRERHARLVAADALPVMRHLIVSMRVSFDAADKARAGFQLLFFAKPGQPPIAGYCDPLATADVRMECRREADGEWRICSFDSGQVFQRG
jgi:SnoaL-like domain